MKKLHGLLEGSGDELRAFRLTYTNGFFHFDIEKGKGSRLKIILQGFKGLRLPSLRKLSWIGRTSLYAKCLRNGDPDRYSGEPVWDYDATSPFQRCQLCSEWYSFWRERILFNLYPEEKPLRFVFYTDNRPYEMREENDRLFMYRRERFRKKLKEVYDKASRIRGRFRRPQSHQTYHQKKHS
jgi:hypothetical protein